MPCRIRSGRTNRSFGLPGCRVGTDAIRRCRRPRRRGTSAARRPAAGRARRGRALAPPPAAPLLGRTRVTTKATWAAALSTGKVRVMRSIGGVVGPARTAQRSRTSRAGSPGKSEAVWPFSPSPSRMQSRRRGRAGADGRRRCCQDGRILGGRRVEVGALPLHPVDALRGDGDAIEQGLSRHPVVAARVVGRAGALVAEVDLPGAPVGVVRAELRGEQLVQGARRAAPGEGDAGNGHAG